MRAGRLLAAVLALACGACAAIPTPATVEVAPRRISERAYYVLGHTGTVSRQNQGFISNAGFVVTDDGVVVFDALGTVPLGRALIHAIRGVTDKPVRRVIVSHYHADHVYGLQAFREAGVEIWANGAGRGYPSSPAAAARLEERRASLAPWVDARTRVLPADRWLDADTSFTMGGITFRVLLIGPAHSPEDVAMLVEQEKVVFAGDLMFAGRIPFVGDADTGAWLAAIDKILAPGPRVLVGGHGPASENAQADLAFTREYLLYLRETMGRAAAALDDFDDAYRRTDWSQFAHLPAFEAANRRNAYRAYLQMQDELLSRPGR